MLRILSAGAGLHRRLMEVLGELGDHLEQNPGQEWVVEFYPLERARTQKQNRMFHACCRALAMGLGLTQHDSQAVATAAVKEAILSRCIKKGIVIETVHKVGDRLVTHRESTADLDKRRMILVIDEVFSFQDQLIRDGYLTRPAVADERDTREGHVFGRHVD